MRDPAALPSTYVLPTEDRALTLAWTARAARERLGVEPVPVDGRHNFYNARPELCAELLLSGPED